MRYHSDEKPITNYTQYALNRIRYIRGLWDKPIDERKRIVADCLGIPQKAMKKCDDYLFQRCVEELTKRILTEILGKDTRFSIDLEIVKRVLEKKTSSVKVPNNAISLEEKEYLFLVYETVSKAVRLVYTPFTLLNLPVNDWFLRVG